MNATHIASLLRPFFPFICTLFCLSLTPFYSHAQSRSEPLPLLQPEPASEKSTYEARILKRWGVHDMDPNVYVYTPEFAKRFQMPMEWASEELKGAEAVAFRVVPSYKTCGWGGDPGACREDAVRCDMDVYFDHKLNPLPWDERMRTTEVDMSATSVDFIRSSVNRPYRPRTSLLGGVPLPREPFTDPKSGKELRWQGMYSNDGGSSGIYMGLTSYDREIFIDLSLVVMSGGCAKPADILWLSSDQDEKAAFKQVHLPQSWRTRVKQALTDSDQRSKSFFKQQGEKALKALQAQPVPSKPAAPIQ